MRGPEDFANQLWEELFRDGPRPFGYEDITGAIARAYRAGHEIALSHHWRRFSMVCHMAGNLGAPLLASLQGRHLDEELAAKELDNAAVMIAGFAEMLVREVEHRSVKRESRTTEAQT